MNISSQNLKAASSAKQNQKQSSAVMMACVPTTVKVSKTKKAVTPSYDFVGIAG
jgi:hypothetical protein|tara:strand:- start:141 stop:302 length:162 start_codon:yes stop_codon:yes gene_type:complete